MSSPIDAEDHEATLATLRAVEIEITQGPDAALRSLGPPSDPERLRSALGILVRAGRFEEATALIAAHSYPNKHWIDLATFALAGVGRTSKALLNVEHSESAPNRAISRRVRLAFSQGMLARWQKEHQFGSIFAVAQWKAPDKELARLGLSVLDPLIAKVKSQGEIESEMDLASIETAMALAFVYDDRVLMTQLARWLERYVPVPLMLGELTLRRITACPAGLPDRLRLEHSNDFTARLLAALIERDLLQEHEQAFVALLSLVKSASTEVDKDNLSIALFESCGMEMCRFDEALAAIRLLRPNDLHMVGLLECFQLLALGKVDESESRLESLRDESDGVWWQAFAQLAERKSDYAGAQFAWEKASQLLPHPDILRRAIQASLDHRRYASAIRACEILLQQTPDSKPELTKLAHALIHTGDYAGAISPLTRLLEIEPENHSHRLTLAQCLVHCSEVDRAISALLPVCDGDEVPLDVLLLYSQLSVTAGRADEAFARLDEVASDHWDVVRFVTTYMDVAYRAGQDRRAHEAFARLLELRSAGKVPEDVLRPVTLEELLEYGETYRAQRDALHTEVARGRVPWMVAEEFLDNPPLWAWRVRTQRLPWLAEEPVTRAQYSLYATNGFVVAEGEGGRLLQRIEAPVRDAEVVIAMSALITLHELGWLERVAEFYRALVVPQSMGLARVAESARLGSRQPSRKYQLLEIRNRIEQELLTIVTEADDEIPFLSEYSDQDGPNRYTLQDLVTFLRDRQVLDQSELETLIEVAHRSSPGTPKQLVPRSPIVVDLLTLRTLASTKALVATLSAFDVQLLEADTQELHRELLAYEAEHSAQKSHDALWRSIQTMKKTGKVRVSPVPADGFDAAQDHEMRATAHLDALKVANTLSLPLLVDDRVIQSARSTIESTSCSAACGTDAVISRLLNEKACSLDDAADAFRSLMKWRYRFVIPPADVLFQWYVKHRPQVPGRPLLEASAYLHDCLRDAGLHCGMEATEPPMPLAAEFVAGWVDSITMLFAKAWSSTEFDDREASYLTNWIASEFVPSCPTGLWNSSLGPKMASGIHTSFMASAMIKCATAVEEPTRANVALQCLAAALGLSDQQFLKLAVETIGVIRLH